MSNNGVAVIGGGIIGLATAYALVRQGAQVTIIDRDPEGDKASFGNAGGIAVTEVVPASAPATPWRVLKWMLDPLGPLAVRPAHAPVLVPWLAHFRRAGRAENVAHIAQALATLNARVYDDLVPMLDETGLGAELHRSGALTVYESEQGYQRDAAEWALKRAHGIVVEPLSGDAAREIEPDLGAIVCRAVFTPQWSHVSDPKRIVDGLRNWLMAQGVQVRRGEVREILPGPPHRLRMDDGSVESGRIVVAAGAWSASLARRLGDRPLLESERGYNMTIAEPGIALRHEIIFAERKFVASPLDCGLRIGGAAEFGGLSAPPNFRRAEALVKLARLYLPTMRAEGGRPWAGHRPATPDSLPVIGRASRHPTIIYAFGHGHLGLTQAATTGRLASELILDRPSSIDLAPFAVQRFG